MYKELACLDYNTTNADIQRATFFALNKNFDTFCVPLLFLSSAKHYLENTKTKLAAVIDYPFGISLQEVNLYSILSSIRRGADIIDIVINNNMIFNANWKDLKHDCQSYVALCRERKIDIRFIIDYRLFEKETVIELCKMLKSIGIDTIITTNGVGLDETMDNIIFSQEIQKRIKISAIMCSSMLKNKHISIISTFKDKPFGYRLTSYGMAESIFGKIGV